MIACLRLKQVWRLLHRYVVPGLCASAIALGGCALPSTTAPSGPATDSEMKGPIATVSMEPPIQVGDVTAVYVTVTNLRSVPVIVLQAHAVPQSGGHVDLLDVDHAIEKAGGADKLIAALGDRSFEVAAFPPAPEPSGAVKAAGVVIGVPLLILSAGLWVPDLAVGAIRYAVSDDKEKIERKEFPVGRYNYQRSFIQPEHYSIQGQAFFTDNQWKGYLFFPRGGYSTLEITGGAIDDSSVASETRCYWWGSCDSPGAVNTIVEQIDRGESPTLRHTETIRCRWQQESAPSVRAGEERP